MLLWGPKLTRSEYHELREDMDYVLDWIHRFNSRQGGYNKADVRQAMAEEMKVAMAEAAKLKAEGKDNKEILATVLSNHSELAAKIIEKQFGLKLF
jgi:hypothetical protein